jgi:hypothetical protein
MEYPTSGPPCQLVPRHVSPTVRDTRTWCSLPFPRIQNVFSPRVTVTVAQVVCSVDDDEQAWQLALSAVVFLMLCCVRCCVRYIFACMPMPMPCAAAGGPLVGRLPNSSCRVQPPGPPNFASFGLSTSLPSALRLERCQLRRTA